MKSSCAWLLAWCLMTVSGCSWTRYDDYAHEWRVSNARTPGPEQLERSNPAHAKRMAQGRIAVGMTWEEVFAVCGRLTEPPMDDSLARPLHEQEQADSVMLYWYEGRLAAIVARGWSAEPW